MFSPFRRRSRTPAVSFGLESDSRGRFRDPRFVSFLSQFNRRTVDTGVQDAVLFSRRMVKHALVVVVAAGCAWVLVESAKAISLF